MVILENFLFIIPVRYIKIINISMLIWVQTINIITGRSTYERFNDKRVK